MIMKSIPGELTNLDVDLPKC